jgi:hypothetical protein
MSVLKFPGKGEGEGAEPPVEERPVYYVCRCGCTTFVLRPGYIVECANCKLIHGGDMGAWQLDKEPPVPPVFKDIPRHVTVVDFHESDLSMERIRRRLDPETTGFVIHATTGGDVHTWGKIEGVAQNEWMVRQLQTAIRLLSDADAVEVIREEDELKKQAAAQVAARVLDVVTPRDGSDDEPDMIDWLEQAAIGPELGDEGGQ